MNMDTDIRATQNILLPPDPERIMEGLRDTGYNFNTSIADIVDNSIAADADKIDITIDFNPHKDLTIYIADNGTGMNYDGLQNAMRYGSRKRSDHGSLGKFGLGLKTGSTAFCRCLSVISRGKEDDTVRKAQWDLDYIAQTNGWNLKMQTPSEDEIDLLDMTADGSSGTLVVWEKVDRLLKNYNNKSSANVALKKTVDGLAFHLSMVYQRFLDSADDRARNISITLNGVGIQPWDPFCVDEPQTEKLVDEFVEVELPDGTVSGFTIRAYLLPRRDDFASVTARSAAKLSNDMQGFYVYRENRLIHSNDWLGMFSREPHFSLLRVEFSFDYTLDDVFNVDIKKSRILLNEEIFTYVKDQIMPAPRRAAEERYRKGTSKGVQAKARDVHTLYILDAKYYNYHRNVPGWHDVVKQFYYRLTLMKALNSQTAKDELANIRKIENVFVFPGDKEIGVQYLGYVDVKNVDELGTVKAYLVDSLMAMRAYALREESDFKMDLITELKGQKTEKR